MDPARIDRHLRVQSTLGCLTQRNQARIRSSGARLWIQPQPQRQPQPAEPPPWKRKRPRRVRCRWTTTAAASNQQQQQQQAANRYSAAAATCSCWTPTQRCREPHWPQTAAAARVALHSCSHRPAEVAAAAAAVDCSGRRSWRHSRLHSAAAVAVGEQEQAAGAAALDRWTTTRTACRTSVWIRRRSRTPAAAAAVDSCRQS